jgi:hypothetical protein
MTVIKLNAAGRPVSITPLVTFRIVFGLLMFFSILRFWWRGWVMTVYINPKFHFTWWGFEWVQPLGNIGMHVLFACIALSALCIAIGFWYRVAAVTFFLSFTYVELIDLTTYLNHYYFISLVAFLLIWLPANRYYSIDVWRRPQLRRTEVPAWTIGVLRFQMAVVYIFAGIAKLDADWLLNAEPMRTWLPSKSHLPIIGKYMYATWVAYLFSWFGAVYDLFIVFFLLNKRTRLVAYGFVLIFHIATAIFFPGIGMFPYVMIAASLIFFSGQFHERLLSRLPFYKNMAQAPVKLRTYHFRWSRPMMLAVALYTLLQLLIPLRFLAYPDRLFWTEEGYRFSWRVMLMEKSGAAYFTVKDSTARYGYAVNNREFLTPLQEKMMSTQPDMILKYAHHLAREYKKRGVQHPEVYGEVYVSLNGERSRLFIDSSVNLAQQQQGWRHYNWILPYKLPVTQQK